VRHGLARAREMPAAEAVANRHAVAGLFPAKRSLAAAGETGNNRLDNEAGNVVHVPRRVTVHALGAAPDLRSLAGLKAVEDIKNAAQLRIERDDLDAAARDEADIGIVVKVESSWIASRDQTFLQARGRENEHLRADRYIQLFEQTAEKRQIAACIDLWILSLVPSLKEPREPIVHGSGVVAVERIVDAEPRFIGRSAICHQTDERQKKNHRWTRPNVPSIPSRNDERAGVTRMLWAVSCHDHRWLTVSSQVD